jgi:hypothetical protein
MKRHTPLLPCTQQQCRIRVKRNRGSSRALSVFDWLHGRSFYRFEWPSALLRLLAIWLAHAVDLVLGWCGRLQHAACALWTHSKQQQCSSLVSVCFQQAYYRLCYPCERTAVDLVLDG